MIYTILETFFKSISSYVPPQLILFTIHLKNFILLSRYIYNKPVIILGKIKKLNY